MLDLLMDFSEAECSAATPAKANEETSENTIRFDEINVENNGSCHNEIGDLGFGEHVQINASAETIGNDIGIENLVETPSKANESPSVVSGGTTPLKKGYGLKKWRRIRRDFTKDGGTDDFNRILKRGLPNASQTKRPQDPSAVIKQKGEGSIASVTSSVRSPSVPSVSAIKGSTSDSRLAVGSSIPVCTDSDNSEDHSSKSSTAASAPKSRFDVPLVMGSTRNKNKVRNPTGKSSGNAILRAQQGKGSIETSKKFRGERVKIEKENSYSSVESDSRSSNAVFAHMERFSGISNGRQSRKSSNHDGENSDDAHISEPQSSDEVQTAYCKENGGEVKDASQDDVAADVSWDVEEEKSDNHRPATDRDPLVDSILSLQAVQETLEREIQKFREIGREHVVLPDNFIPGGCLPEEFASVDPEIHECNLSGQSCFKEAEPSSSAKHKVNIVENNIEEELAILKAKESGVVEPEAILDGGEMLKEESVSSVKSLQEKCREMEIELEDLFRQKIEAEFEYLVITRTTQRVKSAAEDQLLLLEEQKSLAGEQTQMLQKLTDAESKATVVKRQVDKLEASCGELLGTEEVLKMQNRVCKSTFYFIVQLILLFVAFGVFLLQLFPHSSGFVPT